MLYICKIITCKIYCLRMSAYDNIQYNELINI